MSETYSYSKASCFERCPYEFCAKYINLEDEKDNNFAKYGRAVHSILERYAKGELDLFVLPEIYKWEVSNLLETNPIPKMGKNELNDTYYEQGLQFFENFNGYDDMKIVGVEKEYKTPIEGTDIVIHGFVDLILEDENSNLIIRDYKSRGSFKSKAEQAKYFRQLYLYSYLVKTDPDIARSPSELQLHLFRTGKLISVKYDESELQRTLEWFQGTISGIKEAFDFPPKPDFMYCFRLCGFRDTCPHSPVKREER